MCKTDAEQAQGVRLRRCCCGGLTSEGTQVQRAVRAIPVHSNRAEQTSWQQPTRRCEGTPLFASVRCLFIAPTLPQAFQHELLCCCAPEVLTTGCRGWRPWPWARPSWRWPQRRCAWRRPAWWVAAGDARWVSTSPGAVAKRLMARPRCESACASLFSAPGWSSASAWTC